VRGGTAKLRSLYEPVDGVELVSWPEEAHRLALLREQRLPRVLLVAEHAPPPRVDDELEDWTRLPGDSRDVEARARRLAVTVAVRPAASPKPAGGVRA
jgi:hypothetical protein